jgi:hypothetical protein
MGLTWSTYLIRPLLLGGTGQVTLNVEESGDTLQRCIALIGAAPATAWNDPACMAVELNLGDSPGDGSTTKTPFRGVTSSSTAVVSFFSQEATAGWVAGPVVTGVDLSHHYDSLFPWAKQIVVDMLKQIALENPPALADGRLVAVRVAFPRDSAPLPCVSVQMSSASTNHELLGDMDSNPNIVGKTAKRSRGYNITLDLIGWATEPEQREILAPWLASALNLLVPMLEFYGFEMPSFNLQESEDFETLGFPVFLITGSLSCTIWTELSFPVASSFGHLELVQEAP